MLIDWFTVAAQAVNFVILVWLLKRFLYGPILRAIDEREKRIAGEIKAADEKKAEAQQERDEYQRKKDELEARREELLREADDEAKTERSKLLSEARQEFETLRGKLRESLQSDQESLRRELAVRAQKEVFEIARKALADLASVTLEERIAEVFIRRLRELSGEEKQALAAGRTGSDRTAIVRSAFELPQGARTAVEQAVRETMAPAGVRFELAPDLVAGVELSTDGHKLAWSIADYLAALEKSMGELLEHRDKTDGPAA